MGEPAIRRELVTILRSLLFPAAIGAAALGSSAAWAGAATAPPATATSSSLRCTASCPKPAGAAAAGLRPDHSGRVRVLLRKGLVAPPRKVWQVTRGPHGE